MSRSFTCRRYDGQEVDRGAPRARDPCTNAMTRAERKESKRLRKELERLHSIYAPDLKKLKGDEFQALLGQYFLSAISSSISCSPSPLENRGVKLVRLNG